MLQGLLLQLVGHMNINRSFGLVVVAHHGLDGAKRHAGMVQIGGKAVPQHMRGYALGDTRFPAALLDKWVSAHVHGIAVRIKMGVFDRVTAPGIAQHVLADVDAAFFL